MKLQLTVPDYVSIDDFKKLSTIEHLNEVEKLVEIVHIFTDIERDEIRKWDIGSLSNIVKDLEKPLSQQEEFYPLLEFKGQLYGYSSIKSMILGEFMDLENLCKDPMDNYEQIMAILYRPVVKQTIDGAKFKYHNTIKLMEGKSENIMKYYTIEDYDSTTREQRSELFKDFPVTFANGALGFFLSSATLSLNNTNSYSTEEDKMKTEKTILKLLRNIGGGLALSTIYQKVPSLKLPEEKALLI